MEYYIHVFTPPLITDGVNRCRPEGALGTSLVKANVSGSNSHLEVIANFPALENATLENTGTTCLALPSLRFDAAVGIGCSVPHQHPLVVALAPCQPPYADVRCVAPHTHTHTHTCSSVSWAGSFVGAQVNSGMRVTGPTGGPTVFFDGVSRFSPCPLLSSFCRPSCLTLHAVRACSASCCWISLLSFFFFFNVFRSLFFGILL